MALPYKEYSPLVSAASANGLLTFKILPSRQQQQLPIELYA